MEPRASLISLPLECKQAILFTLNDILSLQSMVLSHSSFYTAFLGSRNLILKSFISNYVSAELLPDAFALFRALRITSWTSEITQANLEDYCNRRISDHVTMKDAALIDKFHRSVEFFATDFVSTALSKHPLVDETGQISSAITSTEWQRLLRSFYRYEFYTISYGRVWKSMVKRFRSAKFLQKFSIWEQEQLVCIGEYLFNKISGRLLSQLPIFLFYNEFPFY